MNLIGTALAGIYVVVATWSASATPGQAGDSAGTAKVDLPCDPKKPTNTTVSQPDTTVTVTCPAASPSSKTSPKPEDYIYFDANCTQRGVLADVCPGATVSTPQEAGEAMSAVKQEASSKGTIVTLWFPQLPASQQVVCVKCPAETKSNNECNAVITVAAALPQGPQACAVGGTSITLEINEAGGSAQFKCKKDWTLAPTKLSEAYAEDCSKVETLKDMTRSEKSDSGYVTVKAEKLKKKKLCYLCQPSASVGQRTGGNDGPCKVYVQVSGSTKFSSSVPYGLALPCLAAMLRFS